MPSQYERIRDRLLRSGMSEKEAKRRAAKIHNSQNPEHPVHPGNRRRNPGLNDLD